VDAYINDRDTMFEEADVDQEMKENIEEYVKKKVSEAMEKTGKHAGKEGEEVEEAIKKAISVSIGKGKKHGGGDKDIKELQELLKVVGDEVPKLLDGISDALFGAESGEKYGTTVADFYKKLTDAGMDQKEAFELTKQFMSTMSIGGMLKEMMGKAMRSKTHKPFPESEE